MRHTRSNKRAKRDAHFVKVEFCFEEVFADGLVAEQSARAEVLEDVFEGSAVAVNEKMAFEFSGEQRAGSVVANHGAQKVVASALQRAHGGDVSGGSVSSARQTSRNEAKKQVRCLT